MESFMYSSVTCRLEDSFLLLFDSPVTNASRNRRVKYKLYFVASRLFYRCGQIVFGAELLVLTFRSVGGIVYV